MEDHLEMAWAAFVSTKRELDSLKDLRQKFDESEESNQSLKKSMEACQAEIDNLTVDVKSLQLVTLKQRVMMEGMEKKIEESMEMLASKVRRFIEVGQIKTQRTLVKKQPVRPAFGKITYAPSMTNVHERPAELPSGCKVEVNDSRNSLSNLRPNQSLEGPPKSFSAPEPRSFQLGPPFESSDRCPVGLTWASVMQKELNRK